MSLNSGDKLGPYEVLVSIGKGGMGEVYRARDARVGRDVAIKTSTEAFDQTFERESRAIASLNHPNICTLFDVGSNYLVMEFIEGPTLADRIRDGAMPLEETLNLARQIAEALEAAHEKGVVHRDLKPGNIKVRSDGMVKVLDFGLAKVGGIAAASFDSAPTLAMQATVDGLVLGTPAYMSPEQAKGKPVDKRADIWAFGVVVWEMLTGARMFQGESTTEILAEVIAKDPDLMQVPARVRPMLRRCLEKDPHRRLRDIGDALALVTEGESAIGPPQKEPRTLAWPIVTALLLLTMAALGIAVFRRPVPVVQGIWAYIPKPEDLTFNQGTQATISPDARWISFPASGPDNVSRMYVRAIGSPEVIALPGSEGIIGLAPPPFWSYDSRSVVYGARGKLMRSDVRGTATTPIAETGQNFVQGGTWSRDGVIVYAQQNGNLMQVPAAGGTPVVVTILAPGETAHRWPQFLPDGRRFLYLRVSGSPGKTGIYVGSLDRKPEDQDMQPLLPTRQQAYWVTLETGETYLLTQQDARLLAQPFDTGTPPALSGTAEPIVPDGVGAYPTATAGLWSVSRNGTLVYRSSGQGLPQLTWRDLKGGVKIAGEANSYDNLALSPDGGKVAFSVTEGGNQDIWVQDLGSGKDTHLTLDPSRDDSPVWCSNGTKIVYAANRGGHMDLYEKNADNTGGEHLLFTSDQDKLPTSCSHDSRFLLFQSLDPNTKWDLWVLNLDKKEATKFLKTHDSELSGQFSVDDRWIAYYTNWPINRVYVRPFSSDLNASSGAEVFEISPTNGLLPQWSGNGKRLFYLNLEVELMVVDLLNNPPGTGFHFKSPYRAFRDVNLPTVLYRPNLNGDQFLFREVIATGPPPPFTLVFDWITKLKH